MTVESRGTSNRGKNGNAADRRARRRYLLHAYRADVDVVVIDYRPGADRVDAEALAGYVYTLLSDHDRPVTRVPSPLPNVKVWTVPRGMGEAACRCYRCGRLLWFCTLEVDRIVPGWKKTARYPRGGTYVRENIRPACGGPKGCNIVTGNEDRWSNHKPFRLLPELLDLIRGVNRAEH